MRRLLMSLSALLVAGCAHNCCTRDNPGSLTSVTPAPAGMRLPEGVYPASREALPTTSGDIFLTNLDARIDSLVEAGAAEPGSPGVATLAGLLYHRFKVLGRLRDVERALALLDRIQRPNAAQLRLRAQLRAGLHRFDAALADLDRAAAMDGAAASDQRLRQAVAFAKGDYAGIREAIEAADQASARFGELVLRGNFAAFKGHLDIASLQFFRAQQTIHDTDPYPLAWLYTQQGITLLRFGQCQQALPYLRAAEARIPGYALARDHRAECLLRLGRLDAARDLYVSLYAQTGNPIFLGGQALVAVEAGHPQRAEQLQVRADAAWLALLARQPLAWSGHAAEYYLAVDRPERAVRLAGINLANRQDVLSQILMARAAHAVGDDRRACQALEAVMASPLRPPELQRHAAELPRCGNPDGGGNLADAMP